MKDLMVVKKGNANHCVLDENMDIVNKTIVQFAASVRKVLYLPCPTCHQLYERKRDVQRHVNQRHPGQKLNLDALRNVVVNRIQYKCPVCNNINSKFDHFVHAHIQKQSNHFGTEEVYFSLLYHIPHT